MTSRTPEGKHTKRFIIEVANGENGKFNRSVNPGLTGFFATRGEAEAALANTTSKSTLFPYRVRQK